MTRKEWDAKCKKAILAFIAGGHSPEDAIIKANEWMRRKYGVRPGAPPGKTRLTWWRATLFLLWALSKGRTGMASKLTSLLKGLKIFLVVVVSAGLLGALTALAGVVADPETFKFVTDIPFVGEALRPMAMAALAGLIAGWMNWVKAKKKELLGLLGK